METKIKNSQLATIIENFTGIDYFNGKRSTAFGLINEDVTIGIENRIKKIVRELTKHFNDYFEGYAALMKRVEKKHFPDKKDKNSFTFVLTEQSERFQKEFNELLDQEVTVVFDAVDFKMIENLPRNKQFSYDYELLRPFFENMP